MRFDIFAGLGGGYGGAVWIATEDHPNEAAADQSACEHAREVWESYGGASGVEWYTFDEYQNEYPEGTEEDYDFEDGQMFDSWAAYYAEEVPASAGKDYEYAGALR